jgi:hypothetical protein
MMGGVVRSSAQPDFEYDYGARCEAAALWRHRHQRGIPARRGRLLLVTWRIVPPGLPCLYCLRYYVSDRGPMWAAFVV